MNYILRQIKSRQQEKTNNNDVTVPTTTTMILKISIINFETLTSEGFFYAESSDMSLYQAREKIKEEEILEGKITNLWSMKILQPQNKKNI